MRLDQAIALFNCRDACPRAWSFLDRNQVGGPVFPKQIQRFPPQFAIGVSTH
jgi:hypothetical protein